jgi:hypothetical protein
MEDDAPPQPTEKKQRAASSRNPQIPEAVGPKQIALLLGLSQARTSVMIRDGILPQHAPGLYSPRDCVAAYYRYQLSTSPTPRRTIEEEKAAKIQRENKLANRELMRTAVHLEVIDRIMIAVRGWLRSLPGRVASAGANSDAAVLREVIRVEVARVTQEMERAASADNFEADTVASEEDAETDTHPGRVGGADESSPLN